MAQINEKCGGIFLEMVSIRNEIAALYGYDNYADYADSVKYSRTYSADDMNALKSAAKELGSDYLNDYYYLSSICPEFDTDASELLDFSGSYLSGISSYLDESWNFFTEHSLYSIGKEDYRTDLASTSEFIGWEPIILYKQCGNVFDVTQLAHEMGHFTEAHRNQRKDRLFNSGSLSIFEIHSTAISLLATANYEELFPEDWYILVAYTALELLSYVTDGCMVDDFERTIYENPGMTLDEINDLYLSINAEYGNDSYPGQQYEWVYVNHTFSLPVYYFDYASSAFASLQIWLESLEDYEAAVAKWEQIIDLGAYDYPYQEVLDAAGLKTFEDAGTDLEILSSVLDAVNKIYYEGSGLTE